MRHKRGACTITIGLITLSLIGLAFVATVAATEYYPFMYVDRKGKYRIFTIDTTSGGVFDGQDVDKGSIVITIYVTDIDFVTIKPDQDSVTLTETSIIIQLSKQDEHDLPRTAIASHATGNIGTSGDTFYATGPGWAFGNVR